jgi:hypothetical protein
MIKIKVRSIKELTRKKFLVLKSIEIVVYKVFSFQR